MPRNLERRIEAVCPILDPQHRATIRGLLDLMWEDNRQAWDLQPDGTYIQRRPPNPEVERATHKTLIESAKSMMTVG
jgi:polyphosphate kinase